MHTLPPTLIYRAAAIRDAGGEAVAQADADRDGPLRIAMKAASLTAVAPSYKLALETSMPVSWQISVWYSKNACKLP